MRLILCLSKFYNLTSDNSSIISDSISILQMDMINEKICNMNINKEILGVTSNKLSLITKSGKVSIYNNDTQNNQKDGINLSLNKFIHMPNADHKTNLLYIMQVLCTLLMVKQSKN